MRRQVGWIKGSVVLFALAFAGAAGAANEHAATPPPAPGIVFRDRPGLPEMVVVPAGSFIMGSSAAETKREHMPDRMAAWEQPQHRVSLPSFALGKYDVTFAEWNACVADGGCNGYHPDDQGWTGGERPVINVSWLDAQAYVAWLNAKLGGKAGGPYRLPSEAEWEYAARGGTNVARWWGNAIGKGNANCNGCGSQWDGNLTAPVGSFPPNSFGLYDMLGNVGQWTADCWNETYDGAPPDGSTWTTGHCDLRVHRGGSLDDPPLYVRSAYRAFDAPDVRDLSVGFRVARTL